MKYFLSGAKASIEGRAGWYGKALYSGLALIQYEAGYSLAKESPQEFRSMLETLAVHSGE